MGEFQRPFSPSQIRMNSATDFASWVTPQYSLASVLPSGRLKPVPTGSMKTMSVTSSRLSGLSRTGKGGAPSSRASDGIATRFGPKAPMCSQSEPEPGPPLNRKVTGRLGSRGSFT